MVFVPFRMLLIVFVPFQKLPRRVISFYMNHGAVALIAMHAMHTMRTMRSERTKKDYSECAYQYIDRYIDQ